MKFSVYFFTVLIVVAFSNINIRAQNIIEKKEGSDSLKYSIENCVNEFSADKVEKTKTGSLYWFADKNFAEGRTLKMSIVEPGLEVHTPKANSADEFIFILEGKGEFYMNGKTKVVKPMTSVFYPANQVCGIKNIGETELKYLVIRTYEINK
jgi:mannose-6-phosphate isomerase-like protein (cupin superfamily)